MKTTGKLDRTWAAVLIAAAGLSTTGCDFDITNPGPVADEFLDDPRAFESVVNGAYRQFTFALTRMGVDAAIRTRELHAGSANPFLWVELEAHLGEPVDPDEGGARYSPVVSSVWLAEAALERFEGVLSPAEFLSNEHVATASLWAGLANRAYAEYFCEVVYNGGGLQPASDGLVKAETHLTRAMDVGSAAGRGDVAMAAQAARATVRVGLGDWTGAMADAGGVPDDFEWVAEYFLGEDWTNQNAFFELARDLNRAFTVWNTPLEDYYTSTGDPRAPWGTDPDYATASGTLPPWGPVPFEQQMKYRSQDDPIRIVGGREMRLLEAEWELRNNDMAGAMAILNARRTALISDLDGMPLAPWQPTTMDEAWTALRAEFLIELWLENRRLTHRRRWTEDGVPGSLFPEELGTTEGGPDLSSMTLCAEIPNDERELNPNIPEL